MKMFLLKVISVFVVATLPFYTVRGTTTCQCPKLDNNVNIPSQNKTCPQLGNYAIATDSNTAKHARKLVLKQGSKTDICSPLKLFTKYVKVFDLYFVATTKSPDNKVLHAASILYQYLDNDDDGTPDNKLVYDKLVQMKATMFMFYDTKEFEANHAELDGCHDVNVTLQDLQSHETHPGSISANNFDASLEETFHLITNGYFAVYPELNFESGTHMSCIMDCARGGNFKTPPNPYPDGAWYTYDDTSCKYDCMAFEYIYWGLTTYLGAHNLRKDQIANEWRPHTCEELKKVDEAMFNLITNPKYKFPKKLPVGVSFTSANIVTTSNKNVVTTGNKNGNQVPTGNAARLNSFSRASLLVVIVTLITTG